MKKTKEKRKKVVTIGGGTGSFTLLSGLVGYPVDISAVVAMSDDGGSTGALRDELGVLPGGDIRQCLVALSPAQNELRKLLNYRFLNGGLEGHAFGNIFLAALEKTSPDFLTAIENASHILNIRGEVLPVTGDDAKLMVELLDEQQVYGEENIEEADLQRVGLKDLFFETNPTANPKVLDRIKEADMVVIGPGTFYTSILANLIVPEVSEVLAETKARIIFPVNLTNKKGHTSNFHVEDYLEVLESYIGKGRVDTVLVNDTPPSRELLERYRAQEGEDTLVHIREKEGEKNRFGEKKFVLKDLMDGHAHTPGGKSDKLASTRSFIRHDSGKLARAISGLL